MINIHLLNSGGELDAHKDRIQYYAEKTIQRVQALLPLEQVDVAIMRNPWQVIPNTGVGGTAPTPHTILISLEPNTERFSEQLEVEFCAMLAHELHHTMRYHNPGAMKNLADALVWEGLAQHFEMEFRNGKIPPYATLENPSRMNELLELAKNDFEAPLDYTGWFFGIESRGIPFWCGYALGFEIMKRYFERTNQTAATAWHVPTQTVFATLEA
jgi:uncharacterized protein YjaZ